ncbi:tRNA lysidine(34) synthetase TilS [Neolewinella litorea]|uniref:tRNA(Ile)-lysidine synthase n=1 Tax=Neolewinella litorea TaxID=2562452 RepID=A0A4S4NNK9_9BACT|nr:tRNA lysidine(34) synthetase TilS [Neolewinella litorea]THH41442.1 tRNA lysidine(34) synthetase TilS [Neolewinella litorea]
MSTDHELTQRLRDFVAREQLFSRTDRLLVAVSGGLDSTALAHLLLQAGYAIGLVHCNYQLRGKASEQDAVMVQQLATEWQVPLHSTVMTLTRKESGKSIQLEARDKRYLYFRKTLDEYNYSILCTGHHLDDSLETTLINLIRGTGLAGLRGIPPKTSFPVARPLLEFTRQEILEYAREKQLTWREDESNREEKYLRNALRHRVVPGLRALGMQDAGLRTTLAHLRSAERFMEHGMLAVPGVSAKGGIVTVRRELTGLSREDTLTLLHHLTRTMGFTDEQLQQLVDARRNITVFSAAHRGDADTRRIRCAPQVPAWESVTIEDLPYTAALPGGQIRLEKVNQPSRVDRPGYQYCRLPDLPLHLRPRQPGDRFLPFGMAGRSKKVQDLLTDDKVPAWEKDHVPMLCDQDGAIIAVVGYRISHPHAVRGDETEVLQIRWEKESPDPS